MQPFFALSRLRLVFSSASAMASGSAAAAAPSVPPEGSVASKPACEAGGAPSVPPKGSVASEPACEAGGAPSVPKSYSCHLCCRTLPSTAPGRLHGKTWTCRHCLSLETLLYRHLGSSEKQGWSVDSRADFFRRSTSLPVAGCTWATVKTMIVECQATRFIKEQSNQVTAKSLPLSVWVRKGWTEEAVKKYPSEEDPQQGTLYAIPVKSTTMKEARQLIEEQIQHKEKEVLANKTKGKRMDKDEEEGEPDWDVVPHTPAARGEGPKAKKAKTATQTAAAKEKEGKSALRAASQANKANETMALLAAKGTGVLSKLLKSSETLHQQAQKANLDLPEALQSLEEAMKRGHLWNKACVDALPLAAAAKGTGARLADLPFSGKDLQDYTKAAAEVQKEIRSALKSLKQKEKAAEGDASVKK